jgi:hypothetical protein
MQGQRISVDKLLHLRLSEQLNSYCLAMRKRFIPYSDNDTVGNASRGMELY